MVLLLSGCGDDSKLRGPSTADSGHLEEPGSVRILRWVGTVEETDVRVAILVGAGKARLYFCGGAESLATASRWFNIGFDGGEHLEFEEANWRVHAHLIGGGVSGEVELGDHVTRMFHAEFIAPGTLAGLYEGKADCGRVGLIVSQANADVLPTAQGACSDSKGVTIQQVSPIAPIHAEAGKIPARAPGEGDATLLLRAATLEPL